MYELSRNLPIELSYKRMPNILVGMVFLFIGIIGEFISLYIFFYILNSTSFVESSIILNLIATGNVPLSFFISLLGSFCLIYSFKELFFINGWKVTRSIESGTSSFVKFWKFLFIVSNKVILSDNIMDFTITYMTNYDLFIANACI